MNLEEILSCYDEEYNKGQWRKLKELYSNNKIVPFIGAGMSYPVYPLWKKALSNILKGSKEENDKLDELFDSGRYEEAGEYVKKRINSIAFNERVRDEFNKEKLKNSNTILLNKVGSSCLPEVFNGPIFTTNFDRVIEYFYKDDFDNKYYVSNMRNSLHTIYDAVRDYKHNIYKIHGDIEDTKSWVFTEESYETTYTCKDFLDSVELVCETMNFLFLGCSLTEGERYVHLLKEVSNKLVEAGATVHNFAFYSLPQREKKDSDEDYSQKIKDKERFLNSIGVFPIWFPANRFDAIPVLINALKQDDNVAEALTLAGDQTNEKKHFYLFASNIEVKQAFVDNCFTSYSYDHNLDIKDEGAIELKEIVNKLKEKNIIFVEGGYGTGKTVLSKRVQLELIDQKYRTLFISANDFIKYYKNNNSIDDFKKKLFVMIDGIDVLVDSDLNTKNLDELLSIVKRITNRNNQVSFLINSREFLRNDLRKPEECDKISMHAAVELQKGNLYVVETKGFQNKKDYELFFENINPDPDKKVSLDDGLITQWHKSSQLSCQLPLFAYVIGTYYYSDTNSYKKSFSDYYFPLPDNKLEIYEEFALNTLRGRFREESNDGTINELFFKYDTLLKNLAISMIHEMRKNVAYFKALKPESENFSRQEMYAIDINRFGDQLQKELQEVLSPSKKGIVVYSAINNYFFHVYRLENRSNTMVRFSDINVMFCFAAEYIFDSIRKLVEVLDDNALPTIFSELLVDLRNFELQPLVMDFLMSKIAKLSNVNQDNLLYNIRRCISSYNKDIDVSPDKVKVMLLLYIIHIKFYRGTYEIVDTKQNFFKAFYRLCMNAKSKNIFGVYDDEKDKRYIAESYFMGCSFIGCLFRRLNYKCYNFSRSTIKDSTFEQCNFNDNEFTDAKISHSKFILCAIKTKINSVTINGKIIIDDSIINCERFENITANVNNGQDAVIIFRNCNIQNIVFRKINDRNLKIIFENCIFSIVKIHECKKIIIEVKNSICTGKKLFEIDSKSTVYSDNAEWFDSTDKVKPLSNLELLTPA